MFFDPNFLGHGHYITTDVGRYPWVRAHTLRPGTAPRSLDVAAYARFRAHLWSGSNDEVFGSALTPLVRHPSPSRAAWFADQHRIRALLRRRCGQVPAWQSPAWYSWHCALYMQFRLKPAVMMFRLGHCFGERTAVLAEGRLSQQPNITQRLIAWSIQTPDSIRCIQSATTFDPSVVVRRNSSSSPTTTTGVTWRTSMASTQTLAGGGTSVRHTHADPIRDAPHAPPSPLSRLPVRYKNSNCDYILDLSSGASIAAVFTLEYDEQYQLRYPGTFSQST